MIVIPANAGIHAGYAINLIMISSKTRFAIHDLYAAYAACLDAGDFDAWPNFFTDDCVYKIQPRENYDAGLPLATLSLKGRGMLQDRVYGIRDTLFHQPYYQRHIISLPLIVQKTPHVAKMALAAEIYQVEANYLIIRTKQQQYSEVFNAGRYLDEIVNTDSGFKFAQKICVFDSELIPNSIIYPL